MKNITMRELAQVVCLDQLAKEKEMELSEEEKEKTAQADICLAHGARRNNYNESDIKEHYEH